jgi:GNAT superfamily N-acetyltransferase
MKRVHRIVVKPDYQGIGIGVRFMSFIGDKYKKDGYRFSLVTSSPSFIHGLKNNKSWIMTRKPSRLKDTSKTGVLAGSTSYARLTASFEYIGNNI